jgi:hypothetical protein
MTKVFQNVHHAVMLVLKKIGIGLLNENTNIRLWLCR